MATFADYMNSLQDIMELDPADLNEEQSRAWYEMMGELKTALGDKVDAFASFLRVQAAKAKAIKEESQYLAKRAKAIENKVESLKSYYMGVMVQANMTKVAGTAHTISIRNTKAVSVSAYALDHLPDNLKKVTVEPRKAEIKKLLEAGTELIGCEIVESHSLNIR